MFVCSKAHVSPRTHVLNDQDDPLVVRPRSRTQVICKEGEKPNHCFINLTQKPSSLSIAPNVKQEAALYSMVCVKASKRHP